MHGQCVGPAGTPARPTARRTSGAPSRVAQVAWVQSLSLKENVLFGRAMDEERYRAALECACMRSDVALLPLGDLTEIGEKGITLSGGQKQSTAIARAVYADADLVVMDDPLSALDAHVAKDLFRKCLSKSEGAFKDKAVLLVTHQLQFVHQADHVVVMADGAIVERGAYDELVRRRRGAPSSSSWSRTTARTRGPGVTERLGGEPPERPSRGGAEASRTRRDHHRRRHNGGTRRRGGRRGRAERGGGAHRRGDRVGGGGAGRRPGQEAPIDGRRARRSRSPGTRARGPSSSRWRPWTRAT